MNSISRFRHRNPTFKRNARGMTLIEMIIAIIIGLGLLAAAAGMIANSTSKSDVNADANGLTGLISAAKTLRTNGNYGTAGTSLTSALINLKGVPSTLGVNGTAITNNWGGAVTVVSTGNGYSVTSADMPSDACIEHATKLSKSMLSTTINGGTAIAGQVSVAQANTGCNASGNGNTITWTTSS